VHFQADEEKSEITEVMKQRRLLGSRMRLVVNVEHMLHRQLGVALGSGEALVAEQFLNGPQVGAFL